MRKSFFALLLGAMLLLTSACAAAESPAATPLPTETTAAETVQPVPTNSKGMPYVLSDFEGTLLDPALYEGKAIFLNFFTSWCPYCMDEMDDIRKLYDTYDPEQAAILLVHVWDGEDDSATAKVVADHGLEGMTILEDSDFALARLVGVPGYPSSIFIDKEGYLYNGRSYAITYKEAAAYFDDMGVEKRP
ncbi:MAG: TlpA disulfide reductase family protein [Eubacteriales bacterium]|nr:TlpA disulfide reductase family protein [Eubacteriales bacterium]